MGTHTHVSLLKLIGLLAGLVAVLFSVSLLFAWDGPDTAPPAGNTPLPVNVGDADQVKSAGLSVNALAVFGNVLLSGDSNYLNFTTTAGSSGIGFRNNDGMIQFKNAGGEWKDLCNCGAQDAQGQQWVAYAYSSGSASRVYLSNVATDVSGPHTYGSNTFYVYNPAREFEGTWAEFMANPQAGVASAKVIPVGYTRSPQTRFVFNFAQLESEPAATQESLAASIFSFMPNRLQCTESKVNATRCHVNNGGVSPPKLSKTLYGDIYGNYTDGDAGTSYTKYSNTYRFTVNP